MSHPVTMWSYVDRRRGKCACCGRRISRGGSDILVRDLTGKAKPKHFHLDGGRCQAAAEALVEASPDRWKGSRRHA